MHDDEPKTGQATTDGDQQQTVKADETAGGLLRAGERVGRYVVRERLGEGGFAEVYLAEQQEPVRRRVALKIIKPGMDTRQVIARFEAERQALAMMDHANVARVFDAGSTDAGRPFFVMEHVPGVSITEHCDRQRLSIQERLELFMQVCDAVQHAHQKGIIHRDIKPTNVLVLIKDGKAIPKVIDFGVAKALHQRLTEKTIFTEQGQLIGTPEYMSPEQAEMTAQDIDTRSDIYSLGVLLYELLTGALPFDPTTLRKAAFAEIQRIIREQEPSKPSTRLSSLGDPSTGFAEKRRADPRSLLRELRGDLDWIVMKAMEKDRNRRYETANGLAMDIRRHLEYEPVLAGPPSAAYKLSKFVRRNRVTVAAGSIVALSLIAAAVVSVGFALSEAEQRRLAATERDTAKAVNEFLNEDLLAAVAPSAEKGKGKDVLMRDVLDEAAKRIEDASAVGGRFQDKPLVEASIRFTLGDTYRKLGESLAAEPHLEQAQELRHRVLGEEHPDTLESMNSLAWLAHDQARYEDAESLHNRTLEIRNRVLGKEHPLTLESMNSLADIYRHRNRYEEAKQLLLETLEIKKRVLGKEHPSTLKSISYLAKVYREQGRNDEAAPLYLEALETSKRTLGEEHPDTLVYITDLALCYYELGRYDEAEPLSLESLEIKKRVLGEEHPSTLWSINNLANQYVDQGRYEEAERLYLETLEIRKRVLGEDHPDTLDSVKSLAWGYHRQGRYDEAEPLYLQALERLRRVSGLSHPETNLVRINLFNLYTLLGRTEDARSITAEQIALARQAAEHADANAETLNNLAWLLLTVEPADLRDPEAALSFAMRANDSTDHKKPNFLDTLSLAYHLTGDTAKAVENQKKAINLLPADADRGEYEAALATFEAALPTEQEVVASDKPGQRSSDEKRDE